MPISPIFPFLPLLLLLSSAPLPSTSTAIATHSRRALHQPFFPDDSHPPTQPPSPQPRTPPKYPFSTNTPNQPPFFPSIPSPPSPQSPPSPSSFASFPANISSLILPNSPKPNHVSSKLVAVAVVLVVSAVILTSLTAFLYIRRKRRQSSTDLKSNRSDVSSGAVRSNAGNSNRVPKPRRSPPNSAEFLYIGTVVNSRVDANVGPSSGVAGGRGGGGDVNLMKLDSPELRPLPPLRQQSFRQDFANVEVGSGVEDEEEEFYSPRGSSVGRESSIGTGSASRRAFATAAAENFDASRSSGSSSSSIYSSSDSGSPTRSVSISISPPVGSSPRPKSPELAAIQTAPPPPLPPLPPIMTQLSNLKSSSSPSPSPPSSSSPERGSEKSLDSSPRISNVSISNAESPARIGPHVSDPYANVGNSRSPSLSSLSSPRISNSSRQNLASPARSSSAMCNQLAIKKNSRSPSLSSLSSSAEREKTHDLSPRISTSSLQNLESPARSSGAIFNQLGSKNNSRSPSLSSSSSSSSSSPVKVLGKTQGLSPTTSNVPNPNAESPARISNATPPPPPPLPRPRRHWEIPVSHDSSTSEKTHDSSSPILSNVSNQNVEFPARTSSSGNLNQLDMKKDSRSPSQSSSLSSSPGRLLQKTQDSSSFVSNPNSESLVRIRSSTPPPPPPPPPRRHWEIPAYTQSVSKPTILATAPRPVNIGTPTLVSPIELPPKSEDEEKSEETEKPKLKPLHWDKVRASSDREMVWDQLKSSSFRVNEEMIETLFVVNKPNSTPKEPTRRCVLPSPNQENRVLDPKKAQNIAIALRALNVTIEEVCEALSEGNAEALGAELLESLLKMAPTKEEEHRLKEYKDDSPFKLGPAERFLKAVLDIPLAFKRADAMLYISNFEAEVEYLKKSFETLEAACEELRNSRMFLKLLEAVLKTGNRMNVGTNRGDAHAFKLDTLHKLVDVKGADGKTTLLHFVVQEIIRSEGARLSSGDQNPNTAFSDDAKCRKLGLQVVSGLSSELKNVKKSAAMDSDVLSSEVMKLSKGIGNIAEIVRLNEAMGSEESCRKFSESMNKFVKMAEEEIIRIQAQESVALSLVKEITEYFHGNSAKEEAHPFRIFMVVRDFLMILDRACKEVGMINERTIVSSAHKFPVPVNPMLQPIISGIPGRRQYGFSDDESSSP